jgi:dienelactone hydrolase
MNLQAILCIFNKQSRGWMAISLLVVSSLLLASCATAAPLITPVPSSAAPTGSVDAFKELVPAAKTFVDQLAKGDFTAADSTFDATMKSAMPETKLKDAWNQVIGQAGAFKAQLGTSTISQGDYRIVLVTCQFEKSVLAVQLSYNKQGQISGLYFKPGVAPNTTPAAANDLVKTAKTVVDNLAKGDYPAVVAAFDTSLQSKLTPDTLKQSWQGLTDKLGAYQQQTGTTSGTLQGYQEVSVTCQFEKGAMDVRVVFNTQGNVVGINFMQAGTGSATVEPYSPPSYAKTDSFHESEVTVGSGEWALPGTLTVPNGSGPFPAVVLVHGSGPNDRDETIGPNKPFKDLAWGLASQGIAVLRYDKRTKAHAALFTPEVLATLTVKQETTDDALLAVNLLRQTAGIDPKRVFVLGHSLGATVAPRIGQQDPALAGLILLAGLTRPFEDAVLDQETYLASLSGPLTDQQKAELEKVKAAVARVKDPNLSSATPASDLPLNTPASYWLDLRGYHPEEVAKSLAMPLLVLQGERDYQVSPTLDFPAWQKALAGKSNATLKLYPALNHLFIAGTGAPNPQEYQTPGHVSEQVVTDIAQFVKAN